MASTISFGEAAFDKWPWAPAITIFIILYSLLYRERVIILTPGYFVVIILVASTPSITGICMSTRTISGVWYCICSTRSAPFMASPITWIPGSLSNNNRAPCRTSSWSSAMNISIGVLCAFIRGYFTRLAGTRRSVTKNAVAISVISA